MCELIIVIDLLCTWPFPFVYLSYILLSSCMGDIQTTSDSNLVAWISVQ